MRRKERKDEGEFVRVSETRRVFIRRDGEWRRGQGEGEINVFVLRPPSYAPGREKARRSREKVSRRGGWPRRRGLAPRRISAQRYCFCVQRTSVSIPFLHYLFLLFFHCHPLPPCRSFALVVFSRRVCAPISRPSMCRCDSTQVAN